jgi:hypothetical protein
MKSLLILIWAKDNFTEKAIQMVSEHSVMVNFMCYLNWAKD